MCCEAASDLTVATTLMEARLLAGPEPLFEAMQATIAPENMWASDRFFEEKLGNRSYATIATTIQRTTWNPT